MIRVCVRARRFGFLLLGDNHLLRGRPMWNGNRRTFLGAAFGAAVLPARTARGGPNDRIRVAVAGLARGSSLIRSLGRIGHANAEVAAVCDVDANRLAAGAALSEKLFGRRPAAVRDMRKLLDDKSIDAVIQ